MRTCLFALVAAAVMAGSTVHAASAVAVDQTVSTREDTFVTFQVAFQVLNNELNFGHGAPTFVSFTYVANGVLVSHGGGAFSYTPNANFNGTDTFTYTFKDTNNNTDTATVKIIVTATNDPPEAVDDTVVTPEGVPALIDVLANDNDPDGDPITVQTFDLSGFNGSLAYDPVAGTFTYTPALDFHGVDAFTYTIQDTPVASGGSMIDTATVTIIVNPGNHAPVASDDRAVTREDTAITIDVLRNDGDRNHDVLTVSNVSPGLMGQTTNDGDGTITYTPNPNAHGDDTFTYTVSDAPGDEDTATVTVTVQSVNDQPILANDFVVVPEDGDAVVDFLHNDYDPDGDTLTLVTFTQGSKGLVTRRGEILAYTPDADFSGDDTFTYTVTDGNGVFVTATVTVIGALERRTDRH